MIVDCCSDLHGHYPELEGGDLLIVAGDVLGDDSLNSYLLFLDWLTKQNYKRRVFIAGNHDNRFQEENIPGGHRDFSNITYLCDSGTEFEGLKVWGSPWSKRFANMNPNCKAFTVHTEEELAEKWALISEDVDILITHSPPYGIQDKVWDFGSAEYKSTGSKTLLTLKYDKLKLHVFGHIHEGYGEFKQRFWPILENPIPGEIHHVRDLYYVNASHVNERYEPVNKPIRVIL